MFKIEKRFPKREAIPLKVPEEELKVQKKIREGYERYTEKVKEKYIEQLKDISHLIKELAEEKGEEYLFKRILIIPKPKVEAIGVSHYFPEDLLVPEKALIHLKELKEILKGKPDLIDYLNNGIKQTIIHEREHVLKGPSQRLSQKTEEEIGRLDEKYRKIRKKLMQLKEKRMPSKREVKKIEKLEEEFEKIRKEIKEKYFLRKEYLEPQTELQRIIKEPEINKIAANAVIRSILALGIGEIFSRRKEKFKNFPFLTEKEAIYLREKLRSAYSKDYPFLKPKIIENLVDAYIRIEKEIFQQYLEWKKEKNVQNKKIGN